MLSLSFISLYRRISLILYTLWERDGNPGVACFVQVLCAVSCWWGVSRAASTLLPLDLGWCSGSSWDALRVVSVRRLGPWVFLCISLLLWFLMNPGGGPFGIFCFISHLINYLEFSEGVSLFNSSGFVSMCIGLLKFENYTCCGPNLT